ncbi:hypothetical protein [Chitinophaga arvensicola]|uniref:MetA-pathway of phenol degradation n=1 Tax=Chitinophaga arvensicola TaxID=29529 RepID=A0A1I0SDU9_9BACT|nr:hypothetical protein [Chitinophaga arvensicola]SEW57239.1 hypothetical protein SAMN04488122_6699 [Chitinophaga arvensicola]
MNKVLFFLALVIVLFTAGGRLNAQGCSDAGFCSLGAPKEVSLSAKEKQRIDIGTNIGTGEENTFTINPYLQYSQPLGSRFSVLGKVTATYATGFLGSSFSPGDLYGVATYKASREHAASQLRFLAGIKIPFTAADQKGAGGLSLPLDYQSSLGTYDVILGINYTTGQHWELNTGFQTPVIQNNSNTFSPEQYDDNRAASFAPTSYFRRRPDLLLRAGYFFNIAKSVMIKPSLLAIYHTGRDTYKDALNGRIDIDGSSGLTLNGTLTVSKQFKNKSGLELIVATPFIVRQVRADGLTRSFVANIQYSFSLH